MTDIVTLFAKYMDHVGQCCGTVFLREISAERQIENRSRVVFSDDELRTLDGIAELGWRRPLDDLRAVAQTPLDHGVARFAAEVLHAKRP